RFSRDWSSDVCSSDLRDVFSETRAGYFVTDPNTLIIRRVVSAAPWWSKPLAWILARREIRGLKKVRGIQGVPQLLYTDKHGLYRDRKSVGQGKGENND